MPTLTPATPVVRPCARGWTGLAAARWPVNRGASMRAGMDPVSSYHYDEVLSVRPCARGWTARKRRSAGITVGASMRAGMDRRRMAVIRNRSRCVHARGGEPLPPGSRVLIATVRPCARGWTDPDRPSRWEVVSASARAGMDRIQPLRAKQPLRCIRARRDGPVDQTPEGYVLMV